MGTLDLEVAREDRRLAARIRVVDGAPGFLLALTRALRNQGYDCLGLEGAGQAGEPTPEVLIEVRPAGPPTPDPAPAPEALDPAPRRLVRLDDVIRRHVLEVFRATNDNVTRTALALGISRVALRRRLREYGAKPGPTTPGLPPSAAR